MNRYQHLQNGDAMDAALWALSSEEYVEAARRWGLYEKYDIAQRERINMRLPDSVPTLTRELL